MSAPSQSKGHILVDHELAALLGKAIRVRAPSPHVLPTQVQPASVDLRLGARAWRVRAGFLPGGAPLETRLSELAIAELSLEKNGAVLEKGQVYLVQLEEELGLPPDLRARFNPRSSTGRCDIFTRVLADGHSRFDEAPAGYKGKLWIEVSPLSFPVRLKRGDRLCQLRLVKGVAALDRHELEALHARTPLVHEGDRKLKVEELRIDDDGCIALSVGLEGREPAGWRAAHHTDVLEFSADGAHDPHDFWEPVHARGGRCILGPGSFYIFASRERLSIPPKHAAEMLPVDIGIGELRNNYAGFFDNGFGWRTSQDGRQLPGGTPAVLEVRAHDVPFLVEDGQLFCRLRFFRTSGRPEKIYGEGRTTSYRDQDLTLARCFKRA